MKLYRCNICGNIVVKIVNGGGKLVCCNEPMEELVPKTQDMGTEKHLPVATMEDGKLNIKVGSIEHPMEENHFIEFIAIYYNNKYQIKKLNYTDKPECTFIIEEDVSEIEIYEYCNIHGLWKTVINK